MPVCIEVWDVQVGESQWKTCTSLCDADDVDKDLATFGPFCSLAGGPAVRYYGAMTRLNTLSLPSAAGLVLLGCSSLPTTLPATWQIPWNR